MSSRKPSADEVRFGRVPLWLYEAGVGLQAIATYGWLIGRYGHYDQVMPSYGTLAKELGVSRGSVITYMKALTAAGAVRIKESGAVDHKSNTYEIAFDGPFAYGQVKAGQPADQPAAAAEPENVPDEESQVTTGQPADQLTGCDGELVSGLTRSGQPADQGGQRAVHEVDVFKKTERLSLPTLSEAAVPSEPANDEREGETDLLDKQADSVADAYTHATGRPRIDSIYEPIRGAARKLLGNGHQLGDLLAAAALMPGKKWRDLEGALNFVITQDLPAASTDARASPGRPPHCGGEHCDSKTRMREDPVTKRPAGKCPICHPDSQKGAS